LLNFDIIRGENMIFSHVAEICYTCNTLAQDYSDFYSHYIGSNGYIEKV